MSLKFRLALPAQFDFAVAVATIYWPALTGLERYLGFLTTLGTCYREHLTPGPVAVAIIPVTLCFPGFTAGGAALGLVGIALGLEELLLFSAEGKVGSTIGTVELLVLKTHWMTSSPLIVG
jgi:hypothetical protein